MAEKLSPLPEIPIEKWLSAKEVASHFGLNEDSAYRWMDDGTIPFRFIKFCGKWLKRIHPAVIPFLEKTFEAAHI